MNQLYVLTYVSNRGYPEHWFRKSAKSILKCVDNFMFDDDGKHEDEPNFGFSLVTLDADLDVNLDDQFKSEEMSWPLHRKFKTLAAKIDKKYGKLPGELPADIRVCVSCVVFTTEKNCKICTHETSDAEN